MSPKPQEPEILAFIDEVESLRPPEPSPPPIETQRERYDALCRHFDAPLPAGLTVSDDEASRPDGSVPLRRYRPARCDGDALVVYFHGGGFVVGGLNSHQAVCAELAEATASELVAVDYRLSPEHRFPDALVDCLAALRAQGRRPLVVAGDSAGGTLAAAAALVLRDVKLGNADAAALFAAAGGHDRTAVPHLVGQALIYPALSGDLASGSYREMAEAPALTTRDMRYYYDTLRAPDSDPYAHPLAAADLSGLPPAYITSAFFDPLRDDGRDYTARLAEAGVAVSYREEPQMVHAWLRARHHSPGAQRAFAALCKGLGDLLKI